MNKLKRNEECKHTPDALLNITLKLLDCGVKHCREDARRYAQDFQEVINMLFELFYIISKIFESVHKICIDVGRGLLSLDETKWLRL